MKTLLIVAFYGEIPTHIRMTFGMGKAGCPYEVIREGENIPDSWDQAIVLFGTNDHDTMQAGHICAQLNSLNPSGIVFMLPVEVEEPEHLKPFHIYT